MAKLQLGLFAWAVQRASQAASKGVKIFVSGADREGEGELKIYQHLLDMDIVQDLSGLVAPDASREPGPADSVLLLGSFVNRHSIDVEVFYEVFPAGTRTSSSRDFGFKRSRILKYQY